MSKDRTELVFIIDKSGSMSGLEADTIGGFNSMLKDQQALENQCSITTVLFDHHYELLHNRIDIKEVSQLTRKDYQVGGMTALFDAIGITINNISTINKEAADNVAIKVIFVIITDGEENASKEYSAAKIKQLIENKKEKHGWEFIFLGANIDAAETAAQFGIEQNRAQNYHADSEGIELNFSVMSDALLSYRLNDQIQENWNAEIQEDFEKRSKDKK